MSDWIDGADTSVRGNTGGTLTDTSDPKLVLHTTEGKTGQGAIAAFTRNNSWPHITADFEQRRVWQHLPLSTSARALRNASGGAQTNRDNVTQVEIVGFAGESHTWSDEKLRWLAERVIGPVMRARGIPANTVRFFGSNAGFTLASITARQRLSASAYDNFSGVLGHQHVPENSHWDPGALDVAKLLTFATGTAAPSTPQAPHSTATRKPDRLPELGIYDYRGHWAEGWARLAQKALGVKVDAWFAGGTRDAVTALQRRYGLPVTGVINQWTWVALIAEGGVLSESRKSHGPAVEILQNMLGFRNPSGIFNEWTTAAVEEVQRYGREVDDGIVAGDTRRVLAEAA